MAGLGGLAFFDGDDAVFTDLVHGLGDDLADLAVVVGGDGGDVFHVLLALDVMLIVLSLATTSSTARSMPRFISIGLTPETTARRPSLKMASARTVAVVVPSPATSLVLEATSLTMRAPMFSYLSSSSISLATVTPSLVTVGKPKTYAG